MQCSKCGAVLDVDTVFCPECGAMAVDMTFHQPEMPQLPAEETPEEIPEKLPSEWKTWAKRYRGFLATLGATVGVLLIAAIVIVAVACKPEPCTSALETFIAAVYEGDLSQIRQLAPPEHWQYREKEGTPWGQEEIRLQIIFLSERYYLMQHFGEDMRVSYEIQSQERIESEPMTALKQWAEEKYGIAQKKITDGHLLKYKLSFSGLDDEATMDGEHYALLIDKQWYLVETNYYSFPVFASPNGLYGALLG